MGKIPNPTIIIKTVANKTLLNMGLLALVTGGLFYFLNRPFGATYFHQKLRFIDRIIPRISGLPSLIIDSFPAFVHPFSFSLIGMGLIAKTRISRFLVCFVFMSLNLFCEFGQRYKSMYLQIIPDWFGSLPLLANTKNFFIYGTFDWCDVGAIVLGSLAAFAIAEYYAWRMAK